MKTDKYFFAAIVIFIIGVTWASQIGAEMIKEVAIGVFHTAPNEAQMERYYLRQHGPTIALSSGPWMRRYRLWLPYVPPDEAVERFGALRGRYAELWYPSAEDYLVTHGRSGEGKRMEIPMERDPNWESPLPWERENPNLPKANNPVVIVPAIATELFHNSMGPMELEDTTFIRWINVIRYPEDVSVEEGEKWFLEVHAKEAAKQPGLLKFESYRCLEGISRSSWVRVNEYWYRDFAAWREAVLESPPKYTAPAWGGEYPFVEMVSTFIPYMHYVDFLKGDYVMP